MSFTNTIRTMDKRLRTMLIATGLLLIPQIGQFVAIADLNATGREGNLALFFMFAGIFIVPTSLILSGAIIYTIRHEWRQHRLLVLLGGLNKLISLSLIWFFVHQCSWAAVFGITLRNCQ